MIRAVLFDAAGTLIELREPVGETYARAAQQFGVSLSAWRVEDAFQRVLAGMEPMVFPDASPEEVAELERGWWREVVRRTFRAADSSARLSDFDACFAGLWRCFSQASAWRARSGARELLRTLRRRQLKSAVVSNFDGRLPRILHGLELAALIDAVVLPGEIGAAKPDPRIFAAALERLGVAPDQAVFVGDHAEEDLAGARAVGLHAVDAASLATLEDLHIPGEGDA